MGAEVADAAPFAEAGRFARSLRGDAENEGSVTATLDSFVAYRMPSTCIARGSENRVAEV